MAQYLVRVGSFGQVGRYGAFENAQYSRGVPVIVETARGLECGHVIDCMEERGESKDDSGSIVRAMTIGDHLLAARLQSRRDEAFIACERRLREQGSNLVLMDIEHLFGGDTLVFYFLGIASDADRKLLSDLAETYDAKSAIRSFAEVVEAGCGPQCGQSEGEGACGDSCSSCAVATACSAKRH